MSEIQRWYIKADMGAIIDGADTLHVSKSSSGEWVKYKDTAKLQTHVRELENKCTRLLKVRGEGSCSDIFMEIDLLYMLAEDKSFEEVQKLTPAHIDFNSAMSTSIYKLLREHSELKIKVQELEELFSKRLEEQRNDFEKTLKQNLEERDKIFRNIEDENKQSQARTRKLESIITRALKASSNLGIEGSPHADMTWDMEFDVVRDILKEDFHD